MSRKTWICMDCGHKFSTGWIPVDFVKCPKCGSTNIHRIDSSRGRGYGRKRKRGICR